MAFLQHPCPATHNGGMEKHSCLARALIPSLMLILANGSVLAGEQDPSPKEIEQLKQKVCGHPFSFPRRLYVNDKTRGRVKAYADNFYADLRKKLGKLKVPGQGYVVLGIGIDAEGFPSSVVVVRSSGNEEFNDVVVRAIRENAPYERFPIGVSRTADEIFVWLTFSSPNVTVPAPEIKDSSVSTAEVAKEKQRVEAALAEYRALYLEVCGKPAP